MIDDLDQELEAASDTATESVAPIFNTAHDAIVRYAHCVMCGANLHFVHSTDFSRNLTQETAKCPECGIRVRSVMHRLQ